MAKILNTGDALYAALSHIFLVDDDNTVKELKAGLTCTPHANVLLPGTGSTVSPVGRSFRTGGAAGSAPAVYGVDHPNYVANNAADITVFVAVNQFNGASAAGAGYGAMMFSSDVPGTKAGTGIQIDPATGKAFHHNNNGGVSAAGTLNTAGSITAGGIKSFGFTRTAAGVVKFFANGVVDSAYAGGVANTASQFGAAWSTAEQALIGGQAANSWVSFDYAYICDFLGTIVSEADMLRLHNSLTGSDAFALIDLPSVPAPTFSGTIPTLVGTQGIAITAQSPTIASYFTGTGIAYTVSSALPSGLSINSTTGVISGTPSTDTDWSGTVTATNGGGAVSSNTFAITIATASSPIAFSGPVSAQTGTVGTAYSTLALAGYFSGSFTPFTYAVFSGALPGGLSLNSSTGQISGTPTTSGSYTAVIRATDTGTNVANTNTIAWSISPAAATSLDVHIAAAAGLTGINGVVLSAATLGAGVTIIKTISSASFDGSGNMPINITGLGATVGQYRWVDLTQSNGNPNQSPAPFGAHGPVIAS